MSQRDRHSLFPDISFLRSFSFRWFMDLCFIAMFFSCPKEKPKERDREKKEKNCVIINAHNKQKAHRVIFKSLWRTMAQEKKSFISQRETFFWYLARFNWTTWMNREQFVTFWPRFRCFFMFWKCLNGLKIQILSKTVKKFKF